MPVVRHRRVRALAAALAAVLAIVLVAATLITTAAAQPAGPAQPTASRDPSSVWPDPINESQLGTRDTYYYYARSDHRSVLRTPTAQNPLRIWVGGDSMAGGASYGLDILLGTNPNYEITHDIRKSTGNVSRWFFDWPAYVGNEVSEQGYDVVVLSMGANDNQRFAGSPHNVGSAEWSALYRQSLQDLLRAAWRPGRLVIWVGLPQMRPPWLSQLPDVVNPIFDSATQAEPEFLYIDAAAILTPDGRYVRQLGGEHAGRNVRTADGIHYTFYGGELVSRPIVAELVARGG